MSHLIWRDSNYLDETDKFRCRLMSDSQDADLRRAMNWRSPSLSDFFQFQAVFKENFAKK